MNVKDATFKSFINTTADLLSNSDFISRTIGMNNSYEDIMFIVQALGRKPISLLGKDYPFIFDHVRRNYQQGYSVPSMIYGGEQYGCPKFTFYKEVPTVRFADPYTDPLNLLSRWVPDAKFETTSTFSDGGGTSIHYSESNDGEVNNKHIDLKSDLGSGNTGTYTNSICSFGPTLGTCDLIRKTNDNFNHGKYKTLIARFHTNSEDSKDPKNPTQTAISKTYGMSHGRNLLKLTPDAPNGYDNPYCRVWTYHHQYNQISRMIRPFGDANSEVDLESLEQSDDFNTVGFRTIGRGDFDGGSSRLDKYGVLNYKNGFVNIAPTAKIKNYFEGKQDDEDAVSIKRCMFSIENLAWRNDNVDARSYDQNGLSPEQKGPLGGRIMWFPPYDLTFSEDVRVDWNGNKFIGRGEQIYTYTNTDRSGNLSFTLLIDHPSIIDYWTGRNWKNGGTNQGVPLKQGNSGGIDEKNNQENTLLRFFAGCDILSAKPHLFKERIKTAPPIVEEEPKVPKIDEVKKPDETPKKTPKQIQAILYYPNNYSGVDDGGIVNPIYYLMNGIGTQKRVNEITKNADDFTADVDHLVHCDLGGEFGGYEMKNGKGVSLVTSGDVLDSNYQIIESTYADLETKERKAQYLTTSNGNKVRAFYDGGEPAFGAEYLAKIIGSEAMSLGNAKNIKNLVGEDHLWYRKRYYYRVDKEYENQDFSRPTSYIDGVSTQLNSLGYGKIKNYSDAMNKFGVQEDDEEKYKLVSFADLFIAMEGKKDGITTYSEDNVGYVRNVFDDKNKEKYTNIRIKFAGHASYQGYVKENNKLARNRAETLIKWFNKLGLGDKVKIDGNVDIKNQPKKTVTNVGEQDVEEVKIWRSASVIIEYDEVEESSAAITNASTTVDKVEVPNKETSKNNILGVKEWILNTPEGRSFWLKYQTDISVMTKAYINTLTWDDIYRLTGKNYSDPNSLNQDNSDNNVGDSVSQEKVVERYDNEGEFFELLSSESPFLHHLISQKIRYFDPAFHSISPEGFNARLTFLHQCTRQGSTIEHGNPNEVSAYNLAFGRPPICVLRLGDFYYTKIIINSLNIQYDNPQWDLNPEGIGVMPMFAKVSINFTFLGGSDLAGPIARLQNAVSFNYYANASVYDNRAEMVEYENGKPVKFKGFTYPNTTRNGSVSVDMNKGEKLE